MPQHAQHCSTDLLNPGAGCKRTRLRVRVVSEPRLYEGSADWIAGGRYEMKGGMNVGGHQGNYDFGSALTWWWSWRDSGFESGGVLMISIDNSRYQVGSSSALWMFHVRCLTSSSPSFGSRLLAGCPLYGGPGLVSPWRQGPHGSHPLVATRAASPAPRLRLAPRPRVSSLHRAGAAIPPGDGPRTARGATSGASPGRRATAGQRSCSWRPCWRPVAPVAPCWRSWRGIRMAMMPRPSAWR